LWSNLMIWWYQPRFGKLVNSGPTASAANS
jgi:hypothetical protein